MFQRVIVLGGLLLAACSPATEPAKSAEPAQQSPPAPALSSEPSVSSALPSASATAASAPVTVIAPQEPLPAAPSIHELCFAMCDKVKAKCAQSSFESCRVNCTKYDPPAAGCDEVVRGALECANHAADLVCANVAPESCAKQFRGISACAAGEKPVVSHEPQAPALPSGFTLYENAAEGVRAPLPEARAAKSADPALIVSAKHPDGASYSIRKLPRPAGKLNEKVFLKIAMGLLGRCSDKMKMQGMVDKPNRTSIQYVTKCADGSEEQGVFWATDTALFVAAVHGPAGQLGPSDAFLYGFEAQ
jgi:hypothetical protein